jgi:TPR repeat protein
VLYSMGQGVPQSDVEAYFWLALAADVKGPNQEKYAANRQMVGQRITADELAGVEDRVSAWKAAHPRPGGSK